MKKFLLIVSVLLALTIFGGCDKPQAEQPASDEPSPESSVGILPEENEENEKTQENTSPEFSDEAYAQQIERYYTALSEQWNEGAYFENEMSPMAVYYYEGNALDNVGYALTDMDGNEIPELIIGAIMNSEKDPLVFEIWTLKNGEPVMLAQSGSRNRYYLQYSEDDELWTVSNEAENGAANRANYYFNLSEGSFEIIQGIVFDAAADENAPWFMAYDLDWDVSNDTPIDEVTANDVMESWRKLYSAADYIPYSQYK